MSDTGYIGAGGSIGVLNDPNPPVNNGLLVPGAGVYAAMAGGASQNILVNAILAEAAESYCFTIPGAPPTATELSLWKNAVRSQAVYIRKMQAYFRTGQTTFDVNNYYRLRATGSLSGSAVLPFTAVSKSFLLNNGYGATMDKGLATQAALGASNANSAGMVAVAHRFTTSQVQTISGMTVTTGLTVEVSGFGGFTGTISPTTCRVRCSILDAAGNTIQSAYSTPLTVNAVNATPVPFVFPQAAVLQPGTYFFAFDIINDYPTLSGTGANSNFVALNFRISNTQTAQADGGAITTGLTTASYTAVVKFQAPPSNDGYTTAALVPIIHQYTLKGLIAGTLNMPYVDIQLWRGDSSGIMSGADPHWPRSYAWALNGSPSGLATVNGDVSFQIDSVGTPPGTGLGTDVTVQALLTVS